MKPKIHEYFSILDRGNKILFQSYSKTFIAEGKDVSSLRKIIPYLNGKNNMDKIVKITGLQKKLITDLIRSLFTHRIVFDASNERSSTDSSQKLTFMSQMLGFDKRSEIINRIRSTKLAIIGLGSLGSKTLELMLSMGFMNIHCFDAKKVSAQDIEYGIYDKKFVRRSRCEAMRKMLSTEDGHNIRFYKRMVKEDDFHNMLKDALVVLCSEDNDIDLQEKLNILCVKSGIPWLSSRLYGVKGEVGPLVVPGETSCYHCYILRRSSNVETFNGISAKDAFFDNHYNKSFSLPMFFDIIASYCVMEVTRFVSNYARPLTLGRVLHTNFMSYSQSLDPVLKAPFCTVCSL